MSNLAIIIIHRIAVIFCYAESAFNHDELFLETRDRPLVSDDRPRHTRVSIRVRCFDDGKPKFRHNRNSPSAGRQRLLATYFIGRHICRWQRQAFERLIINNQPQQWLCVIKATGFASFPPLTSPQTRLSALVTPAISKRSSPSFCPLNISENQSFLAGINHLI